MLPILITNKILDFAIVSNDIVFQTPLQNVKILLLQNGNFNTAIKNVPPQYTIGNQLVYKYDKETQFWGGNEFLYFENKDIRAASNNVGRVGANNDIYNSYLYTNQARANQIYTVYQDVNGNFVVKNINASNNEIEADYAWVYFTFRLLLSDQQQRHLYYRNVQQLQLIARIQNGL